jgi:uncharacterized protein YdeI (YjbR/CyaY-like superfamily)
MAPLFFSSQAAFRQWLEENYQNETELLVGFHKVGSGKPCMTWSQSVDQALCFGWIDGIRKSIDNDSYCIRFTPRKPTSIWSAINIAKVEALIGQGLMQDAGLESFKKKKDERSGVYSFESEAKKFSGDFENRFKANQPAWEHFSAQAPTYRKRIIHWIMTAKQEQTRLTRLEKTITESGKQQRLF